MRVLFASLLVWWSSVGLAAVPGREPPGFLTDVEGRAALQWVGSENRRSLAALEADPHFAAFHRRALQLAQAGDRIPMPDFIGASVYNLWQDPTHVRGVWRRTSLASYRTAKPDWTVVLDLDALAKHDRANWVWKGADCAAPAYRRCLISLSDGGEDATTVREFDLTTRAFVPGGFSLPRSKQEADWDGDDAILVARDWGPGTTTTSGYAFVVKRLARGTALGEAAEYFRGKVSDVGVMAGQLVDGEGDRATLVTEEIDAFNAQYRIETAQGLHVLHVPTRTEVQGFVKNRLVLEIDTDWQPPGGGTVKAGSLVSVAASDPDGPVSTIFAPGDRQSLDAVGTTRDGVVAAIFDNVRGQAWTYAPSGRGWTARRVSLPDDVSVGIATTSDKSDQAFLSVTGFLHPTQLWLADGRNADASLVKALPAKFDASNLAVEQYEATAADGTKIPYIQ